jgi:2-polyprenyl-3-methyl-5-hydroxy-6-metoxy-1,4-benzoquinol methylase
VSYDQSTYKSRFFIKRFSHGKRFSIVADLCKDAKSLLDYGTGSAYLLKLLSESSSIERLTGYEPMEAMYQQALITCQDLHNVVLTRKLEINTKYDCITCLEVLEHLEKNNQVAVLNYCFEAINAGGKIVISVPIEVGLAGLIKNILRLLMRQSHTDKWQDIIKSFLGLNMKREATHGYIYSHIGFKHRDITKLLMGYKTRKIRHIYSPVNTLGRFFNSQVIYVIEV